ncbi:MAG: DUF4831 family protein [Paludibacteraceae bacterium]|nr:DUF4831 family protein [Paludibacteraceae bacterium]
MKNLTSWFMAMLLCSVPFVNSQALTLTEDEPVVVYYMPQTQLLLTAEYDEILTEVGPFYQYSERYLGTKDVQTKADKHFVLNKVSFAPIAQADTSRSYVLQDKTGKAQLLSLSPFGTLAGYNLPLPPAPKPCCGHPHHQPCKPACETLTGTSATHLMPLLEEQLMASSTAKMAEGAAKLIYRIREMRLNLLAGDVERAPADGEAMKQVLAEMDRREQELTALFVGRRTVIHHTQVFCYTPKSTAGAANAKEESILFRFSKYYGIVADDDLSGEAVKLVLNKRVHQLVTPEKAAQKGLPTIYYNIPGNGELIITYAERELVNHPIDVAQWGVSVPVNSALLNGSTKIAFNPATGAIVSIEK